MSPARRGIPRHHRQPVVTAAIGAALCAALVVGLTGCSAVSGAEPSTMATAVATHRLTPEQVEQNLQEAKARAMLSDGAQQMQSMQKLAAKLDVEGLKRAGIEMQATADDVLTEAQKVTDPQVRELLVAAAEGLRTTGEGAAESSPKKSYAGVNQVLGSITKLNALDQRRKSEAAASRAASKDPSPSPSG